MIGGCLSIGIQGEILKGFRGGIRVKKTVFLRRKNPLPPFLKKGGKWEFLPNCSIPFRFLLCTS